jgi:tetratricopeptide (TPR) repeat protein
MSEEEKKDEGNGKAWSGGAVFGHILLAIFVPILGIIFGAVSLGKGGKRKKQGIAVLIIGIVFLLVWFLIIFAAASGGSSGSEITKQSLEEGKEILEEQKEAEEVKEPEKSQEEIAAEYLEAAKKAYDQDNYEEALKHYTTLLEADRLDDAVSYYRYAYSDEQVNRADLEKYLTAYEMLQDEAPGHKYLGYAKKKIYEIAPELDYRTAMLEDYNKSQIVYFEGQIFQIIKEEDDVFGLIQTAWDEYLGYNEDNIMASFGEKARVLEDDIIKGVGEYLGLFEYTTALGVETEVPAIEMIIYDVVEE